MERRDRDLWVLSRVAEAQAERDLRDMRRLAARRGAEAAAVDRRRNEPKGAILVSAPWSFQEARTAAHQASANQRAGEEFVKEAHKGWAQAEKSYRVALAQRIIELRAAGNAATLCSDLARGDERVAELKFRRDVAEGVKEAAVHAAWRNSADRRDTEAFVDWSKRRELAEVA
jgi:hypothetical protein